MITWVACMDVLPETCNSLIRTTITCYISYLLHTVFFSKKNMGKLYKEIISKICLIFVGVDFALQKYHFPSWHAVPGKQIAFHGGLFTISIYSKEKRLPNEMKVSSTELPAKHDELCFIHLNLFIYENQVMARSNHCCTAVWSQHSGIFFFFFETQRS